MVKLISKNVIIIQIRGGVVLQTDSFKSLWYMFLGIGVQAMIPIRINGK